MRQTKYLCFIVVILLLCACRSSRHAARNTEVTTPTTTITEWGEEGQQTSTISTKEGKKEGKPTAKESKKDKKEKKSASAGKTNVDAMTAKLNLSLSAGSKQVSVGGAYRLKRNDVIQINLTYTMIISVSVGTLELTPDYILVLDRINKRYCKMTYDEVPSLAQAGIDFDYLQRIFWGEAEKSPSNVLEWSYADWQPLGNGKFPGQITFSVNSNSTTYKAIFNLSNIKANDDWDKRTEVSSKYTPISFDAVMKALMSLAK